MREHAISPINVVYHPHRSARRCRALHRPDWCRLGGQARAQLRRLRHPDGAGGGLLDGDQGRRRAARFVGTLRTGASGRQRTFDRLQDRFLPNTYDPPSFALKLAHKDMRLATELGRELGAPMRLANMAFAEMTEALNRGWENRDSRSPMLLQLERCGLKVEVDPQRIQEVLDRDPPFNGGPDYSSSSCSCSPASTC